MITRFLKAAAISAICCFSASFSLAAPVTYIIDSGHTYPAFEADHNGGVSLWRGKINSSSGSVILDKEAESGTVEVEMDITSIDFGHDGMNKSAVESIFNVKDHPTSTYTGTLADFENGAPTKVEGTLTLNGVSKEVTLDINQFLCVEHFRHKREVCGADASTTINRTDFGVDYAINLGFFPEVKLLISIEAVIPE